MNFSWMQFQLGLSHPLWPQPPTFFSGKAVAGDAVAFPGVFLWMGTHKGPTRVPPIPSEELSQILQLRNETKNGILGLPMFFLLRNWVVVCKC